MADDLNRSGIYCIRNLINGNRYVGSAKNIQRRWYRHKTEITGGRHENGHLSSAVKHYGIDAFEITVLEYVDDLSQLLVREQHYLDTMTPEYNICQTAGNTLGRRNTPEAIAKMKAALTGRHLSPEHCAQISLMWKGQKRGPQSPEHKANLSAAKKGKPRSPEASERAAQKLRGRIAHNRGVPHSEETRDKMRVARANQIRQPHTEEAKEKIRLARAKQVMRPRTEESKASMSAKMKGHIFSPETIERMRIAQQKRWQRTLQELEQDNISGEMKQGNLWGEVG